MSGLFVSELVAQICQVRQACSQWHPDDLAGHLIDRLNEAVVSQFQLDLSGIVDEKRLAYASIDDLIYPADVDSAQRLWSSGRTAILQSLQTRPGLLNTLCAALEVEEGRRVGCSAYISGPKAESFALHTDDWDAFIVQLQGDKTFWIEDSTSEELRNVDLRRGGTLYLPRRIKHRAHSNAGSMHLSINFLNFPARLTT